MMNQMNPFVHAVESGIYNYHSTRVSQYVLIGSFDIISSLLSILSFVTHRLSKI